MPKITYRKITHEICFAKITWDVQKTFPRWFVAADAVWTPDYSTFVEFWRGCEVWGMFIGEKLAAIVYLEIMGESVNIHVSVLQRIDKRLVIAFFNSLLTKKHAEGINNFRAWIFEKNYLLSAIAGEVGFIKTGFKFYKGWTRSSPIRWIEFVNYRNTKVISLENVFTKKPLRT